VLLDEAAREQRHWNNDGVVEDVATGSAAGVIGAYRLRHGLTPSNQRFDLHQGRFRGRPSVLQVTPVRTELGGIEVQVSGLVSFVGQGELEVLPG
jgi:trans-2,3-dihydro-3-hydroxyanthranilate isomerase